MDIFKRLNSKIIERSLSHTIGIIPKNVETNSDDANKFKFYLLLGAHDFSLVYKQLLTQKTVYWRAIKLPIYSVVIIPSLVASACSYAACEIINLSRMLQLIGASILIIVWLNISNDVFDADSGVDLEGRKPESVLNILGWKKHYINTMALLSLGYGLVQLRNLTISMRPCVILQITFFLTLSILLGYIYQGPPMRLSYLGLGEPLCFMSFGPLATTALYLSIAPKYIAIDCCVMPIIVSIASVLIGLSTTSILFCSHFHQVEGDRMSGKMSPIVKIGTSKATVLLSTAIWLLNVLELTLVILKVLPPIISIILLITLPFASYLVVLVWCNHNKSTSVASSKIYATLWHIFHGLAIILSITIFHAENFRVLL